MKNNKMLIALSTLMLLPSAFAKQDAAVCDDFIGKWYSEKVTEPLFMDVFYEGDNYLIYYNNKSESPAKLSCFDNSDDHIPIALIESRKDYTVIALFGINKNYLALNVQAKTPGSISQNYSMTRKAPTVSSYAENWLRSIHEEPQPYVQWPDYPCDELCTPYHHPPSCKCPDVGLPPWN